MLRQVKYLILFISLLIPSFLPMHPRAEEPIGSFLREDIQIREYKPSEDKEALIRLIDSCFDQLGISGETWVKLADDSSYVSVILVRGRFAGFIEYCLWRDQGGQDEGHVYYFAIDQKYRSFGLGTILMGHAVDRLHANGAKKISLNAYSSNTKAHKFYTKFGFQPVGSSNTCVQFLLA